MCVPGLVPQSTPAPVPLRLSPWAKGSFFGGRLASARGFGHPIGMRIGSTSIDAARLSVEERLRIIEELWLSLEADSKPLPVPDWHRRGIEARHETYVKTGVSLSLGEAEAAVAAALRCR